MVTLFFAWTLLGCLAVLLASETGGANPEASTKFAVVRAENPHQGRETLLVPYAFSSDSIGTTIGIGGMVKGYLQEQLLLGGTVFGSSDAAAGGIAGMWDLQIPAFSRLFLTAYGSYGHYPRQRAYTAVIRPPSSDGAPAGANNSDPDDYIEENGEDSWLEFKFEYVLPVGAMRERSMARYHLRGGLLESGATGGDAWNPLASGVSVLMLGQSNRYQDYETAAGKLFGQVHPLQLSLLYNNTDFPPNPSRGSYQWLSYSQDFFSELQTGDWSFVELEAGSFFDLGPSKSAKQRVLALNLWTGTSPSWSSETDSDGNRRAVRKPPFFEGARLGGFHRMRGYPNNRFNDRAVIYAAAEYRHTLHWNPLADISWLRWLACDWIQLAGFVEGGRVAGEYRLSELSSDWKYDGGLGLRAMLGGAVVRLDLAVSEEGSTAWVMFGHPF